MIAFDADIFTEILIGSPAMVQRAAAIPVHEQSVPVIVVEEILRGRLNAIRQAQAGKARMPIDRAYELFVQTVQHFQSLRILPYDTKADTIFQQWRGQKIHVGTSDLRIGAICVTESATLVTRNRRDFERIPGLSLEIWS